MRLKKYFTLFALIFTLCFLQAGKGYSARLSDGNEKVSSPRGTKGSGISQAGAVSGNENRSSGKKDQRLVSFDYDNVDINMLIKVISDLTGKNFIVDNNVRGKVTIISPTKVTIDEAYKTFESVLEVNGFTTVPSGKSIKIVPIKEAVKKDLETRFGDARINLEDRVVTQIIPLKYASPRELKRALSAYSPSIVEYEPTGMLIVTDVQSNISRLLKIIKAIDIPGTGEEINVIPLKLASAQTMATNLEQVFRTVSGTAGTAARRPNTTNPQITVVPDERTNSLIVVASEVDTLKIKELVSLLDKNRPRGEGGIRVYPLQNADAEELAKTLNAIPKEDKKAGKPGTATALSKDTKIVADKATNSLIITAEKDDYEILENVIQKLDRARSMVYIEALIIEVSMVKDFEIGVQWQAGKQGSSATVFSASNPGVNNFPSIDSTGNVSLPTGLTYGVLGNTITIGGIDFPDIGAVFRAYASDSDVQIKSKPQIMTLDNQEAKLEVTNRVPYITSRDVTNTGSSIAYSNYAYENVGVKLTITPQINQERFVRLKLSQEVSQLLSTDPVTGQPTFFQRKADTTVTIKDGETVVIGGLIDGKDDRTNYKVPLLGRIPLLGWLFRSRTNSSDKKNLYIFVTPHIIENPAEANKVYEDKKGHIDTIQEGAIRMNNDGKQPEDMRRAELGYKYLQLKDYEKAMKYYRKALDKNPKNPYAIYNIGYIYQIQGERQKAIEMYEKLIAMNPPDRAVETTEPFQDGRKLTDMAKDNLKSLKTEE